MQPVSLLCAWNISVSVDYILAEYKDTRRKGGCSSTPDKIAGIPIQAQVQSLGGYFCTKTEVMKHIVVLSGSPRKGGNSDILCDEFIRGAVDAGNTAEKITISEKKIGYCTAWDYCQAKGGECTRDAEMTEILEKVHACGGLVVDNPG